MVPGRVLLSYCWEMQNTAKTKTPGVTLLNSYPLTNSCIIFPLNTETVLCAAQINTETGALTMTILKGENPDTDSYSERRLSSL